MIKSVLVCVLCTVVAGLSMADTYRFVGSGNWLDSSWQNQTAETLGNPPPGPDDAARMNWGNNTVTLDGDAGTIDALQIGVDESGTLILNTGAALSVDAGNWSGLGAGGTCDGTLIINDGLLTVGGNNWQMAVNTNPHTVALEINGGQMRVDAPFIQNKLPTASTTLNGGLLDVNSLDLSVGTFDIAGGTLVLRGDYRSEVTSWQGAGLMTAHGGLAGSGLMVAFTGGVTTVTATSSPPTTNTVDLIPRTNISEGSYTTQTLDGRTVWVPNNAGNRLYFDVPASFVFVPGVPVYVRIEYHDAGRGRLFAEYDSSLGSTIADKFRDAELHTRSSRVGQAGFVYSYQVFESPLFAGRQNGGNDFRFNLTGSDGTPLRIAGVQLSNQPYDDEQLQYVLSRPWLQPYAGPTRDFVDPNTLSGKVMTGYQGWFGAPNDPDDNGWRHWGRGANEDPSPTAITIDMWPWIEEYDLDDIYPAGDMVHQDGRPAYVFSSRDPEAVRRHFRWMRTHDIDGAYLQRFVSRSSSGYYGASEFVLSNVRAAANQEGRVWAIEYDVSSLTGEANPLEVITNDWNFLVNDCDILSDPRYVYEDGKPVLFIWGFSVPGREGLTLAEADAILDWFGTQNLYLIAGVHSSWESNTGWYGHYQKYDQLLAWMERDPPDLSSQKARLDSWGMKILPHAWPGFSWHNLQMLMPFTQYTARADGDFYWERLYNAVNVGADQIFLGMFDEYDEGTAIMPMSDNHPDPHTAWGHYIDNEGLDPFWYLQLSSAAREMLNGLRPLSGTTPAMGAVPPAAYGGDDLTVFLGTVDTVQGLSHTQPPDGATGGAVVGGNDCRTNAGGGYFYFDIDDAICFAKAEGQAATVEIEFFDNYPGSSFRLQYDGLTASYTLHPDVIQVPDTGGWKTIRWNVTDGFFGNRQNEMSDFRIFIGVGNNAAIHRVSLFLPEEQGGAVSGDGLELLVDQQTLEWPVASDAVGWRLAESAELGTNQWQEVPVPFNDTNGMMQYPIPGGDGTTYYRLQRPARK